MSTVKAAIHGLGRNKLRSALTMLGVIVGVAALIAMLGVGNGAKAQVEAQIASLGQNVVMVTAGSSWAGGVRTGLGFAWTLTVSDADAIAREVPGILWASPECATPVQAIAGGLNWNTLAMGESEDYLDIRDWKLAGGAMFSEADVRAVGKTCLLGQTVAREVFPAEDPVGKTVRLGNIPFMVCGVLTRKGLSVTGVDQDDVVVIPYTSFMKRLSKRNNLSRILIRTESASVSPHIQNEITGLLRQRHRIQPGHEDDFTVRGQQQIAESATASSRTLTILLGIIASVSLFVGGIGIMNIMLANVSERTREIGIRMAVGARRRDILMQFILEALTLSSIGGLLGIAIGIVAAGMISTLVGWPTVLSVPTVVVAFMFSALASVFFAYYPAHKASRMEPIEALRYE